VLEPIRLVSADQTEAAAACLAGAIREVAPVELRIHLRIHLEGNLGAGKTTFARGLLRALGHAGRVPSPTYTLVEPYECAGYRIYHMDLYRLQDGAELEYLGIDDMSGPGSILLIEWPSRAHGVVKTSDIEVALEVIPEGRALSLAAGSPTGEKLAAAFAGNVAALNP
jgi:tRNA threonylcarbamoyladenosine biosynthesis protein TsaE